MKKKVLKLFMSFILCLLVFSMVNTLTTRADSGEAIIDTSEFRKFIRDYSDYAKGKHIEIVKFLSVKDSRPSDSLDHRSVGTNVTAYYDPKTNSMIIYSPLKTVYLGSDCDRLFWSQHLIEEIDFGDKINTSRVTKMTYMFSYLYRLKRLDLSRFDTSKVTDFSAMFSDCYSLTELSLGNFNTSKAENMCFMFTNCRNIKRLDLSNFNTSNVKLFQRTFDNCSALESLDISNFEIKSKESNSVYDFLYDCTSLKQINAPKTINRKIYLPYEFYLDDDKNNTPDNHTAYEQLPISSVSHTYIHIENPISFEDKETPEDISNGSGADKNSSNNAASNAPGNVNSDGTVVVTVNGIEYSIDKNKNATVTKISTGGKVKLTRAYVGVNSYPVIAIADNAAKGNKKLTSVSIGKTVSYIGSNAFSGCKKLKAVKISASSSLKVGKNAFKKIGKKATITISGVKGAKRKKIVRMIKKQTNASAK